jgi:hypothetical protein
MELMIRVDGGIYLSLRKDKIQNDDGLEKVIERKPK